MNPRLLNLEVTTRCNGRCVYCVRDDIELLDMPLGLYMWCIDSFPDAEEVWPHGTGEPLLWPHIVEGVKYARDTGMKVVLYTNGALLDEEMARALIDAGLTRLTFSVDAADRETYNALRPGLDFDRLVDNAARFCKMSGGVFTEARITVTPENEARLKEIISFWKDVSVDSVRSVTEKYIPTRDFAPLWSSERDRIPCAAPLEHFVVRANGDVVLCCRDRWAHYKMGNVYETTPRKIWEGSARADILAGITTGVNYPRRCDLCNAPSERMR